ncbi:glycosyltransferase [Okeania sp. SIO1I7]|uniref:glycosyltransferase n=1 Tax=Okeania sp. SIO1I7 TaxID=2607772 RepID=UPI0025F310DF|nr:glycosyltransferase [Okeania sp. SIO1I7]
MQITTTKTLSTNQCSFPGLIYFYLSHEQAYEHLMINIADGLKMLGVPFYANFNNWKTGYDSESYLFNYDSRVNHWDCPFVVLSNHWLQYNQRLPESFFDPKRKYVTVYLDDIDGPSYLSYFPLLENFDFILRTGCNSVYQYPDNVVPWVFGISNRILQDTQEICKFDAREKKLLINYRVKHDVLLLFGIDASLKIPGLQRTDYIQDNKLVRYKVDFPLRKIADEGFYSLIQNIFKLDFSTEKFDRSPEDNYHYLLWQKTGKRHHPAYYQRLTKSAACATFGGCVVPNNNGQKFHAEWWDSWRFWESLAAGCVTFHIDFDKYGVNLPVMPENWKHYIGIDLDDMQATVDRLVEEPEILERISIAGREWAIENYSPVPTALRFLEIVSDKQNTKTRGGILGHFVTQSLSFSLTEVNLITFPDWSQPEEMVGLELQEVIKSLLTHPDKSKITLLVDNSNISAEDADLILSSVAMNLLMEEELEVDEGPEIILVGELSQMQWSALIPQLQGRIKLKDENQEAKAQLKAENIPVIELNSLPEKIHSFQTKE